MGNMYTDAKTWSPYKGCEFDCIYCRPSFQAQAKRLKHLCTDCYNFTPHEHPERLAKIPGGSKIVFVCGNGDLAFCRPAFLGEILDAIAKRNHRYPHRTYYLQSKRPITFAAWTHLLPSNVALVTTLETNSDEGYEEISKAPPPSVRWKQFCDLDWPHKVITVEPIMSFDHAIFLDMIVAAQPEQVWIGFNSRPRAVQLPEPTTAQVRELIDGVRAAGIAVVGKELRGMEIDDGG